MAFPASLATATVTGQFLKYPGEPASGTVTFSVPAGMFLQSSGDDIFIAPFVVVAALDGDGAFEVELPVTNDAQWMPQGWSYAVNISTQGATLVGSLSLAEVENGTSIDLADRFQPSSATPGASYVTLVSVGQVGGPAGPLDEDGLIPAEQLPGGGGGSVAWASITGKPTTFPPSAHSHAQSDVTGLVDALAGKAATSHTHTVRQTATWSFTGTLVGNSTGTMRWYNRTGQTLTVHGAWAGVNTAPTGAGVVVDVNRNGTTMYASGKPTIVAAAFTTALVAPPAPVTLADGDYVTVDVDSVGSTIAGSDLTVGMVYSYAS